MIIIIIIILIFYIYFYHFYEFIKLKELNQKVIFKKILGFPNLIFKSYKEKVSYSFYKNNEIWKIKNKDFNIIWFNDNQIDKFMENFFISIDQNLDIRIKNAYKKIKPKAYKVDLWRLCILYKYGGVYVDAFVYPYISLKNILRKILNQNRNCELISVYDCDQSGNGIHNGFIISKKRNKLILECIKDIIENIEKSYYGTSSLCITGPLSLKKTFERVKGKYKIGFNYKDKVYLLSHNFGLYQNIYFDKKNNEKVLCKYYSFIFYIIRKIFSSGYSKLWKNKIVYN